ncbi:MAG: DNA mismatch repair protein, partial [Acidobacteriota bacterium]
MSDHANQKSAPIERLSTVEKLRLLLDITKTISRTLDHETRQLKIAGVKGFIASVEKPRDLKIMSTDERAGIDLFVNG